MNQKKHFIAALKDNRLVALSEADKKQGRFIRIDTMELTDKTNHFAFRTKLFIKAIRQAYAELQTLRAA